jgi:tetratricopeptide (TPR) repeat protein/energy-coupling factor transporter ATP-binding protein EcfA2
MIATGIAAGVVGNALYDLGKKSVKEYQEGLQDDAFSTPMSCLREEFAVSLKNSTKSEIADISNISESDVEENWNQIIEEINSLDPVFSSHEQAITKITDAIIEGLGKDMQGEHEERGKIEIAVARTCRQSVHNFLTQVKEEGLSEDFQNVANIRINRLISSIDEEIERLEEKIIQRNDAELRNEGFVRFDPLYFRRKQPASPETAWRRGFRHVEVEAGYTLLRERPTNDGGNRIEVAEEVIGYLHQNDDVVVLGEPGSGKSTICKQVACKWHEENPGGVYYRSSNTAIPFDSPGTIIEAINATEGDILVVLEDAVHQDAAVLFEIISEFRGDPNVSFLLDARRSHWNGSDDSLAGADLANLRAQLRTVEVPDFDIEECRRTIEHFEKITGTEVERSADSLFEEIHTADYGGPLLLAYRLTGPVSGSLAQDNDMSALEYDVYQAFKEIDEGQGIENIPRSFRHKVGILINLINAARLPISKEFLYSIVTDREDQWKIESTLDDFEGLILIGGEQRGDYGTFHERWSTLYLSRMYEEFDVLAVNLFEECVSALINVPGNSNKIDTIQDWLPHDLHYLPNTLVAPQDFKEYFIAKIAQIATRRPELAPLFLDSNISFPDNVSQSGKITWANSIGLSAVYNSKYTDAESELEKGIELVSTTGDQTESVLKTKSVLLENIGTAKRKKGDLRDAWEKHKQSLEISEELEDISGIAESLNNIGSIYLTREELDKAEYCFKESLELKHQLGHKGILPSTLDNLGIIERKKKNLNESEFFHRKALEIERELGRDHEVAKTLSNLGLTLVDQRQLDSAENSYERALEIYREVDDSHGIAQTIGNLGLISNERGDKSEALRQFEEAYQQFIDLNAVGGAINSAKNIALIYQELGNEQGVDEWCNKGGKLAKNYEREKQARIFEKIRSGNFERSR